MRNLVTAAVISLSNVAAHAGTFVHQVYEIGPEVFADCEAAIDNIAASMASAHAITVTASYCEVSPVTSRTTGLIAYTAEEALKDVSTYTFASTYAPKGVYNSKAQCEQNLAAERAIFRDSTGLTDVYAFCSMEPLRWRNAWYAHIAAFGEAVNIPQRLSWHSDVPHGKTLSDLKADLNARFGREGFNFVHVTYHDTGASGKMAAFFYGPREPDLRTMSASSLVTIPGLAACNTAAQQLAGDASRSDRVAAVTTYCSSGFSNPTSFELVLVAEGLHYLNTVQHGRQFQSLAECEGARAATEQELRAVHGDKLVATVCGQPRFSSSQRQPFHVMGVKTY